MKTVKQHRDNLSFFSTGGKWATGAVHNLLADYEQALAENERLRAAITEIEECRQRMREAEARLSAIYSDDGVKGWPHAYPKEAA